MISGISPYVERFEKLLAGWLDVRHVVACSSGAAALHLACAALGLQAGEKVVVPELTYIATANAVAYTGAEVVPVDVDAATWNISVPRIAEAVEENGQVKAVICTHLLGNPCDMRALAKLCAQRDLLLIEDACEALGGAWNQRPLGGIGDAGCFSFYGNKHLTTGEGGALVTNHDELAATARHLRSQAGGSDYVHDRVGFNYRMTGLQAAVGLDQGFIPAARRGVLHEYAKQLPSCCRQAEVLGHGNHAAWVMGVELPCASTAVRHSLAQEEIETRPMFRPISEAPMYGAGAGAERHPEAYRLADRVIMLPCLPGMSTDDVAFICDALRRAVQ